MNINSRIGKYGIIDKNHSKNGSERKNNISGAELNAGFNSFHTDNSISINKNGLLSNAVSSQLSFKSLNNLHKKVKVLTFDKRIKILEYKFGKFIKSLYKPRYVEITKNQIAQAKQVLNNLEPGTERKLTGYFHNAIDKYSSDYVSKNLNSANLSKEYQNFINNHNMIIREPSHLENLGRTLVSPITGTINIIKRFVAPDTFKTEEASRKFNKNLFDFKGLVDLINKTKNEIGDINELKAVEDLRTAIQKNFEQKGYSVGPLTAVNRVVSGVIPAVYLSGDAYNQVIKLCGDGKESQKDARKDATSRFKQEVARVGLSAYLGFVAQTVFKGLCDRSMIGALAVQGIVVAACEIVGRKLIGKPVLPMTKEQFDKWKKEHPEEVKASNKTSKESKSEDSTKTVFSRLDNASKKQDNKKLSFGRAALFGVTRKYESQMAKNIKEFFHTKEISTKIKEYSSKLIKPLSNLGTKWNRIVKPDYTKVENLSKYAEHCPDKFSIGLVDDIINAVKNQGEYLHLDIGYKANFENAVKAFKPAENLTGKQYVEGFIKALDSNGITEIPIRVKEPFLKQVVHNVLYPIFGPIAKMGEKIPGEIQNLSGKTTALRKINQFIKQCGDDKQKLKSLIEDHLSKSPEGATKNSNAQYDTKVYSVLNRFFAGAITGTFLVADIKNQTMQYTDGNINAADEAGKSRIAQETARLTFSTYIMNLTHSFFSGLYNASLPGAAIVTASNSLFTETMARLVVGMPIGPASKEKIEKTEAKMANSKNPVIKFLAHVMGKKKKSAPIASTSKVETKIENKDASKKTEDKTANTTKPVIKDLMKDFLEKKKPELSKR